MTLLKLRTLTLALLVVTAACKSSSSEAPAAGGKRGRGGAGLMFATDVMPVEAKPVTYLVTAPGTIDAFERVQVTARVSGAVDRVAFKEGQEVEKGDLLVIIDSARYALAVNGAGAQLAKSAAEVSDAEAGVKRREDASVANPGLIPGEELATFKTKVLTAKADRAISAQAMATAQLNLRDSSVRAPIDGIIQTRTIETGQYVQAGYIMATLLRSDPLLLRFMVEPAEAPRLKVGMVANFTMRETQRQYSASIGLVGGSADAATHMVQVTAEVVADADHKYWLRPGSFCDVAVDLSGGRTAPLIPRTAARATDHGTVAFVVEGDVAHERILSLGMSTRSGWIEVRSGIKVGELLVVRGAEALTEGAKVKTNPVTNESVEKGLVSSDAKDAGAPPSNPAASASSEAAK